MPSRRELTDLLRAELLQRLMPAGWSIVELTRLGTLFGLTRRAETGLDATVSIGTPSGVFGELVVALGIDVGVGYAPLRELAPLLCDYELEVYGSALYADGALDLDTGAEEWEDECEGEGRRERIELQASDPGEVRALAGVLAGVVVEHGCRVADRYANVDELIADLHGLNAAALLAGAGRLGEAGKILDELPVKPGFGWESERRCAYQLRRWINSGGDRSLLPAKPPPERWQNNEEMRPFSEVWSTGRKQTAHKNAALQAARDRARGLSRDEQRAILAQELRAHGMSASPIDVEVSLDHLWDTRADELKTLSRGAFAIGKFGMSAFKAMRGTEQQKREFGQRFDQKFERTSELEAPEPAFFDIPTEHQRFVGVDLDGTSDTTLARIYELAWPKAMGIGVIREAWLVTADSRGIAVHIGEWKIGTIQPDAEAAFTQAMQQAGFREERPKLGARIARLGEPPRYFVDIAQPASW